jgi:protein TonB
MSAELRESTGVMTDTQIRAQEKAGRTKLIIGAIAALVVIGIGVGAFMMMGGTGKPVANAQPAQTTAPDRQALQRQAEEQKAEAQRLEAAYQAMLEKQSKDLQQRYDEQLAQLRKEMETAKTKAAQAQQAAEAPPPPRAPAPAPTLAQVPRPAATQASVPPSAATAPPPGPAPTVASAPAPAPVQPEPAPALPTDVASTQAAPSGATPPRLLAKLSPTYPAIAQRMRKEATVVVRVLVDERGRVMQAELKGGQAGYGFDQAALQAAKGARFAAATQGGQPVKMWVDLPIHFKL